MHLGIFAKTFPRPTLEETLDAIADRGLTHVQFNMSCAGLPTLPERIDEKFCRSVARAFRERGLTMAAISGTFNLCDPNAIRLIDNLNRLEVLAAACRWLDTRIITLCAGTRDPEDMWRWHPENVRRSTWDSMIESMRLAARIAVRHEVTLAFEPELNNVVNSVSKARRLLDEIGSPWLKVVIDPANLIRPGELSRMSEVFEEAFDWLGPDIVLAHAKDPYIDERLDEDQVRRALESDKEHLGMLFQLFINRRLSSPVQEEGNREEDDRVVLKHFLRAAFFRSYFESLSQMNFAGGLIMHGMEEGEVDPMVFFLRELLKSCR